MAEIKQVSIGGIDIALRPSDTLQWALSAGVKPFQSTIITTTARARAIMTRAKTQLRSLDTTRTRKTFKDSGPLVLRVSEPGRKPLVVTNLYAIQFQVLDENRAGVTLVDRRWLWSREHIVRDYNVRRTSGDFRLVGSKMAKIQVKDSLPDFIYRRMTLKEGVPYTAKDVLEDLLTQLVGKSGFRIGTFSIFRDIVDLSIDDSGTAAMQRVLGYIPGAQIFVDLDGKVVVYNSLDGSEGAMIARAGPPIPGSGLVQLVDKSPIRPKNVISLFDLEPEIRFNYTELDSSTTRTTPVPGKEARTLQNVIPVTDPTLTLNGKTVARNTWLPIEDWLSAVEGLADYPGGASGKSAAKTLGALNQTLIRKHYLSGFQHLRNKYVLSQLGLPDPLWSLRLDAVQTYWRGAFRVLPQWMDKIFSIVAVRASILDQENGTRGKAEAYFDYTVRPSHRTLAKKSTDKDDAGWTIPGYKDDLSATDARPGPADVVVLDPSQGIFQLVYRVDPWGDGVKIAPGGLVGPVPTEGAGFNALVWNSTKVKLKASWKMAVVLTVRLATPNNQSRLHAESVSLAQALKLIPGRKNSGAARGPDWKIRVHPGIQTARAGWLDSRATDIEAAVFSDKAFPKDLLVNRDHLRSIAEANAARVQALMMDRHEGKQTVSLNANVKPTGSLAQVTHVISGSRSFTHLSLPAITTPPDIYALLPDSTRKHLQRGIE